MFKYIAFLFFIYTSFVCFGQGEADLIDRLSSIEDVDVQSDSVMLYAHQVFMKGNFTLSESILDIGLSNEDTKTPILSEMMALKSKLLALGNDYEGAIAVSREALDLITQDSTQLKGVVLSNTCRFFQLADQMDSMLVYFDKSEQWHNQHNPYRKWILYEHTSKTYSKLRMYDKAESLLKKAYQLTKPKNNRMDHGLVLFRLSNLFNKTNDYEQLVHYKKEYFDFLSENDNTKDNIHSLLDIKLLEGQDHINKLSSIKEECLAIDFKSCVEYCNSNLGKIFLNQEEPETAIQYLKENLRLSYYLDPASKKADLKLLSEIYASQKRHKNAYETQVSLTALVDSVYNMQSKKIALEYEEQYQSAQKEKEIAFLADQNTMKDEILRSNKTTQQYLITSIVLLIGLLSMIYFLWNQRKKHASKLEAQNNLISKNLEEKDILLREIHHRVKNNLQVVSSLLSLQSNYITDNVALDAINEGRNRVSSMALIHQNLYQQDYLTSINVKHYLNELVDNLFDSYNINEDQIDLVKDIENIRLDIDTMIPLGLIINELISNALKHAFNNQNKGKLIISIKVMASNLELIIKDNGVGMDEMTFKESVSFGNKMINAFQQKLGASLSIINEQGTTIKMVITKFNLVAA